MGWRGELRAVAASPLMWGFACLCVATEILGYSLGDMVAATPVAAGNFSLFSVGRAGAVALALLLSMRMASLAVSRWSSVAILGAAAAGSLLMIGGRAVDGSSWWAEAGALLVVASSEFLWLILFELLASLSLRSLRATLALAALVNAALVPLFALEATAAAVACAVFLLGGAVFVEGSVRQRRESALAYVDTEAEKDAAAESFRDSAPKVRIPVSVIVGFMAIALAFGYSQTAFYAEGEGSVVALVMVTKIVAVVLFVTVVRSDDASFAPLFRVIAALALAAYVLFSAGLRSVLSIGVLDSGFSLFELVSDCAIISLVAQSRLSPLRTFSVFSLLVYGAQALGGGAFNAAAVAPTVQAVMTVAIALVLVVVATWAFNDKDLIVYFWGKTSEEVRREAVGYEEGIERLSARCGLTPREREVLALFALGRSAVFIAEELFVSETTVRTHVKHIYGKCDVHSRQELISLIVEQGMREIDPATGFHRSRDGVPPA